MNSHFLRVICRRTALRHAAGLGLTIAFVSLSSSTTFGITLGQIDDFQSGTTMNWLEGGSTPNEPMVLPDSGPLGVGDFSLFNESSGTNGAGGKAVMFNYIQWTGDFTAAGVTSITGMMKVSSNSQPVSMRVAFAGLSNLQFASTVGVSVPNDDQWHPVTFPVDSSSLTLVGGSGVVSDLLANVTEMRILSSVAPSWRGDTIQTYTSYDNLTAVPEPSAIVVLTLGATCVLLGRRGIRPSVR